MKRIPEHSNWHFWAWSTFGRTSWRAQLISGSKLCRRLPPSATYHVRDIWDILRLAPIKLMVMLATGHLNASAPQFVLAILSKCVPFVFTERVLAPLIYMTSTPQETCHMYRKTGVPTLADLFVAQCAMFVLLAASIPLWVLLMGKIDPDDWTGSHRLVRKMVCND